jgi:hypothetical protein
MTDKRNSHSTGIACAVLLGLLCMPAWVPSARAQCGYRTVNFGGLIESNPSHVVDSNILYNAIVWASGKAAFSPIKVMVLDTQGTNNAWWSRSVPGLTIVFQAAGTTITLAQLNSVRPDVLVLSNGWHGPPDLVPPPNPGGGDWTFTPQEVSDIEAYVGLGRGLIATGGSFGQFAYNPATGARNYDFAPFMGVISTGGGNPACANAFPWSRGGSVGSCPAYAPTRALDSWVVDAPSHPIVTTPYAIPSSWATDFVTAASQWMAVNGATAVAHARSGSTNFSDGLITAYLAPGGGPALEVTEYVSSIDYVAPGDTPFLYVTAKNVGCAQADVTGGSLGFPAQAHWKQQLLSFRMDDADADGLLDLDGSATWIVGLTFPAGTRDGLKTLTASIDYSGPTATADLAMDVQWKNEGDRLVVLRHHDSASRFTRCADYERDAGTRKALSDEDYGMVLDAMKSATDDGYKLAHTTTAPACSGLANWGLTPGQEEGNEGNGTGGLKGN